jgi:hypothetical protein
MKNPLLFMMVAIVTIGFCDKATAKPIKVFILAGQSNMEGAGVIKSEPQRNGGKGSLEYLVKDAATAKQFSTNRARARFWLGGG